MIGNTELVQTTTQLHKMLPAHLKEHGAKLLKSVTLLQKAKAYSHNFNSSKAAITAALTALVNQLKDGHAHDKAALQVALQNANTVISNAESTGKSKCRDIRNKSCPF